MLEKPKTPILISDIYKKYPTPTAEHKRKYGIYKCSCGKDFEVLVYSIESGKTLSCGCYSKKAKIENATSHGLSRHELYGTWNCLISRCTNKKDKAYINYGYRGIKVCERWKNVMNFINDMYPSYKKGLSIDRIDNNGNYEPSNCRWTNKEIQNRNTRILQKNNKSGYRGVHKHRKKWRAKICVSYVEKIIISSKCRLECAYAYDKYIDDNNLEHTKNFS